MLTPTEHPGPVIGYTAVPVPGSPPTSRSKSIPPVDPTPSLPCCTRMQARSGRTEFRMAPMSRVSVRDKVVVKVFQVTGNEQTVRGIVPSDPQFSTLAAAVDAAGLARCAGRQTTTTFCADERHASPTFRRRRRCRPWADLEMLTQILLYHAVSGKVMSADLADGDVETLQARRSRLKLEWQSDRQWRYRDDPDPRR